MFVYNITIKVDKKILAAWMKWQLEEHIPEIMSIGLFTDYKIFQLLEQDDSEGPTYVLQFFAIDKNNYEKYINEFAPAFRKKELDKWGNGFVAFRTSLKVMH